MELERSHRYLEAALIAGWLGAFWLQSRTSSARLRAGGTDLAVRRPLRSVRWGALTILAAATFLWTRTETAGWAHALAVPTLMALGFTEIWSRGQLRAGRDASGAR